MIQKRKPRRTILEDWYIAVENDFYVQEAVLEDISDTGALFSGPDDLSVGDKIIASPAPEKKRQHGLTYDEVRYNPDRIKGTIVRKDGRDRYGIQLDGPGIKQRSSGRSSQQTYSIEESKLTLYASIYGDIDIHKFAKIHDQIMNRSKRVLRVILDLSEVNQLPQTAIPIIKDMIENLISGNRVVIAIGCDHICPKYSQSDDSLNQLLHAESIDAAEQILNDNSMHVLVVEDDKVTAKLVEHFLETRMFKPHVVSSAEDGLEILEKEIPDFIILDISLPGMDGLEAARKIRQHENLQHIPIIMFTSDSRASSVLASREAAVNSYVLKPFDSDILESRILEALTSPFIN